MYWCSGNGKIISAMRLTLEACGGCCAIKLAISVRGFSWRKIWHIESEMISCSYLWYLAKPGVTQACAPQNEYWCNPHTHVHWGLVLLYLTSCWKMVILLTHSVWSVKELHATFLCTRDLLYWATVALSVEFIHSWLIAGHGAIPSRLNCMSLGSDD